MELFFDTETSGLFDFKKDWYTKKDFPWIVQIGAVLAEEGIAYAELNVIVKPEGRIITEGAEKVHNISVELAERTGIYESTMARVFAELIRQADTLVCHNWNFDSRLVRGLFRRMSSVFCLDKLITETPHYCTMLKTTKLCKIEGPYGFKWPKLQELHEFLFGKRFVGAHDAMFDIKATMKCYYELVERGWINNEDKDLRKTGGRS